MLYSEKFHSVVGINFILIAYVCCICKSYSSFGIFCTTFDMFVVLNRSPFLLGMDARHVDMMVHNIKSVFPPKEMRHLIRNYPDIFLHPWEQTLSKIMYINDVSLMLGTSKFVQQ